MNCAPLCLETNRLNQSLLQPQPTPLPRFFCCSTLIFPNILSQVAYWRLTEEVNHNQPIRACCTCDKTEIDFFKARFDAAWGMRAYITTCKDVLDYDKHSEVHLFNTLKKMSRMLDDLTELYTPITVQLKNPTMTILPYNYSFDTKKPETEWGGTNSRLLDLREKYDNSHLQIP